MRPSGGRHLGGATPNDFQQTRTGVLDIVQRLLEGLARPLLIGRPSVIEARIKKAGLRMKEGGEAPVSDSVRVVQGAVEGSNVNVVESMVGMIEVQRQFEMQMKLLQTAESNEQRASQILSIRG